MIEKSSLTVGVDIGGTFTDLISFNPKTGEIDKAKVPTTPDDPGIGFIDCLRKIGSPEKIGRIIHGSTISTNTLVERTGSEVCYVTTKGFEDIPFIQRINRRYHYDFSWTKPKPLVKRRNILGVTERLDCKGHVLKKLNVKELKRGVRAMTKKGIDSYAVCFLFSYVNPKHEFEARKIILDENPDAHVSISFEVHSRWKEYERASTTIADAYLREKVARYLKDIQERTRKLGVAANISIMKSNGGLFSIEAAKDKPIHTLISGLAGGAIAGRYIGQLLGLDYVLTMDMGGTSFESTLIRNGNLYYTTDYEIEWGVPIQIPFIEIRYIGAGGGSIGWIDPGGLLRVGPRSAGAKPGPACYGAGGTEPTVTDANLIMNRMNPDFFLGGEMKLDRQLAEQAVDKVAKKLDMNLITASSSIVKIAVNNAVNLIRMLFSEKVLDPRDFTLVAWGGAGPLHASLIARELYITNLVIPPYPYAFSALGFVLADARVDRQRTVQLTSDKVEADKIRMLFDDLVRQCLDDLKKEGHEGAVEVQRSLEMRYLGQNYEIDIPLSEADLKDVKRIFDRFHNEHYNQYGYRIDWETIEIINFKVSAIGKKKPPKLKTTAKDGQAKSIEEREVYFDEKGFLKTQIYRRDGLQTESIFRGPAIIEEYGSTTLILPDQKAKIDRFGNILIGRAE